MKIGFPYLETNASGQVVLDSSFRTSPLFGVYDVKDESIAVADIRMQDNQQGGGLISFFETREVDVLISPECHPMAAKYFTDNEISIYQSQGRDLISNIEAFLQSRLKQFSASSVEQAPSCGSSCSACSSKCASEQS